MLRACDACGSQNKGPVKGFSEALEQRLEATEILLLKILLAADENVIISALQNTHILGLRDARADLPGGSSASGPTEMRRASLISNWGNFPLDTFQDVRNWKANALQRVEPSSASVAQGDQGITDVHMSAQGPSAQPQVIRTSPVILSDEDSRAHNVIRFGEDGENTGSTDLESSVWPDNMTPTYIPAAALEANQMGPLTLPSSQAREGGPGTTFELPEDFKKQFVW